MQTAPSGSNIGERVTKRRSEWQIATLRCHEIGQRLRGMPDLAVGARLLADPRDALLGEILAAAVCHGTNWDRLRLAIAQYGDGVEALSVEALASLPLEEFKAHFGRVFDTVGLARRHQMFVETARLLASEDSFCIDELVGAEVTLGGAGGLYQRLARFPAFGADPEAKKLRILVQELTRTKLIVPRDPGSMRPAIEYHLIRLYLRTQRVLPTRRQDQARLRRPHTLRAHVIMRIRRAVEEAMVFTASAAEMDVVDLNFAEWQIARSFCDRSLPRCSGPPREDKPCDPAIRALSIDDRCPLSDVCAGAGDGRVAALVEPQLASRHTFY